MANVLVEEQYLQDIADAIRTKNGSSDTYTPAEMATAIEDITTGGSGSGLPNHQLLGTQVQLTEYKTYTQINNNSNPVGNTISYSTSTNNWRIAKGNIQKDQTYIVTSRLNDNSAVNYLITDNDNVILWKQNLSSSDIQIHTYIDTTGLDDSNGLVLHVSYGKQDVEYALNQAGYTDFFITETRELVYPVAVRKINKPNTNGGILHDIMAIFNGTGTQLNDTNGDIKYLTQDLFYGLRTENTYLNKSISINLPAVEYIDKRCFYQVEDYKSYSPFISANLPNCIGIGSWAFQNNANLTTIYAPKLEIVGQSTFRRTGLTGNFEFPALKEVGYLSFGNCSNLTGISLPNVEFVGQEAFGNCTSLVDISMPKIKNISGTSVFLNCTSLVEVSLPLLEYSSNYIFDNCSNLKKASLPSLTTYYSAYFRGCSKLEEVLMGNPIFNTTGSFPAAKGTLKKAVFPNLNTMSAKVLENFTVLETLVIGTNLDTVCSLTVANAFAGTPIASGTGYIYVPDDLVSSYQTATNWSTYASQIKGISELPQD